MIKSNSTRSKSPHHCLSGVSLYPVTCEELSAGRNDEEVLESVMLAGAKIIQLRDKHSSKKQLLGKARHFRRVTEQFGALLIINDHIDIAIEVGADGVHLGQEDLSVLEARGASAHPFIIGISCHSLYQALRAQRGGASYVNIGPIFDTRTKTTQLQTITKGLGMEIIDDIAPHLRIPFTVMGGIKAAHIPLLLQKGIKHIAMITEITQHQNIRQHTESLLQLWGNPNV